MQSVAIIGLLAGVCTSAASIPQIVTTVKKKKAADVSPFMFVVLLVGNGLWIYYGLSKSDVPIYAANIVSLILDIVMLVLQFRYKRS
jgi:MtN3 and saliva related transmembrane protein